MNKLASKLNGFLQFATVLFAVGFYSATQTQIVVYLQVNADEDKLEITTLGACGAASENGYVKATGKTTQINFNLTGNKNCSSSEGAKWELDDVYLGMNDGEQDNITDAGVIDFNANKASGLVEPLEPA